jgi:Ca-activated chloride channel family protein
MHHWFAHSWAFWLLAVLPVLTIAGMVHRLAVRRALARVGDLLALRLLVARPGWLRRLRGLCLSLGLSVLVLGIAGPQWGRDWEQTAAPGRDLVVVLDLSRSMLAETPSRLHRAQAGLIDLSQTIQRRGGHRLALVVFAARARVVCPLTHDYDHFREAVESLDLSGPPSDLEPGADSPSGTRIGLGLQTAVRAHDPRFQGHQDILLLSDGDDPADDAQQEWQSGAEEARRLRIPVHVVGIGDPNNSSPIPWRDGQQKYADRVVLTRLQEKPLQEIARLTGGTYLLAQGLQTPPVGAVFRERIEPRGVREDNDDALPLYQQHYPWFLGAALLLLALEMAIGRTQGLARRRQGSKTDKKDEKESKS